MGKKGRQLYVPPVIIEEMEHVMREENLTVKTEALRKVGKYAKMGRKIKHKIDIDKITPTIPIGKKVNMKELFNL